jgi:hypothetical protein
MRKTSIFLISAILAVTVSLIGCSQKSENKSGDSAKEPNSSFSAGEAEETTPPGVKTPAATTKSAITPPAAQEQATDAATANDDVSQNQPTQSAESNQSSTPPPAQPQPPEAPPQPAEPPATPQPTEPPKPKTAYDAPYDTAQISADAKAYGESIGMTWSEPLTKDNCSWEAPGATSSTLSGERLKEAIQNRIRRIKKLQEDNEYQPGEFHFKVYFESAGGGEYTIYFLMG